MVYSNLHSNTNHTKKRETHLLCWSIFILYYVGLYAFNPFGVKLYINEDLVKQFLLHLCNPSCYFCQTSSDTSRMMNGCDYVCDKGSMSVVICDTDSS